MKFFIGFVIAVVGAVALALLYVSKMPGASSPMSQGPGTEEERAVAQRMSDVCEQLSNVIGHRSTAKPNNVLAAREFIEKRLGSSGLHAKELPFATRGLPGVNIEAEIEGTGLRGEIVVVGAHYDSDTYCPGADDNASGCAMLIEVARALGSLPHDRTVKIVFFDFGSSRFAGTVESGSHFWVEDAKKAGLKVAAMISLDSIGRFTDEPGSQGGPFPLSLCYPKAGNFLLVVGDIGSRQLVQSSVETMRMAGGFPSEGLTVPAFLPWFDVSDHTAFRKAGWPAIVITDTGPHRNPEHGTPSDTRDRLQYDRMAKASTRILKVVERLAKAGTPGTSLN